MDITLTESSLKKDIRMKSHLNVKNVEGEDLRYNLEVGTDKDYELGRCIQTAAASLKTLISRWVRCTWSQSATDADQGVTGYTFSFTNRRAANKAEILAVVMHDYIVHASLYNFYVSVSQPDFANIYLNKAAAYEAQIKTLLNSKVPPRL